MAPKGPGRRPGAGSSPSSQAAALLSKARAAASAVTIPAASAGKSANSPVSGPSISTPTHTMPGTSWGSGLPEASSASSTQETTKVPLPQLLKQLTSEGRLSMLEAMPIAGKLIKGGFAIPEKLTLLSSAALQNMGVEGEETRRKVVAAFAGKRSASRLHRSGGGSEVPAKRRRKDDDETLSREWGNVAGPSNSNRPLPPSAFVFNEVLEADDVKGRYAIVNRAPVMTAWTTIVLERLGFNRAEALSLSHCYVSHTSTARGISIGVIPASERHKASNFVSPSQPHFELMGVKIPVMQTADGQWRGLSGGEVIGPERAFTYLRKSMFQTLPLVMGALTLLADSYLAPATISSPSATIVKREPGVKEETEQRTVARQGDAVKEESDEEALGAKPTSIPSEDSSSEYGPEALHAEAFALYVAFRPETGGAWGQRARFELGKVLALRKGHEKELQEWEDQMAKKESRLAGQVDEAEHKAMEDDTERMIKEEGQI